MVIMLDMAEKTAAWRKYLTPQESADLERAEKMRDAAKEHFQVTFRRLKDRCIKRLRRAAGDTDAPKEAGE